MWSQDRLPVGYLCGWTPLTFRTLSDAGISYDYAKLVALLTGTTSGLGEDAALLGGSTGTSVGRGADAAALLAHLAGTDDGVGGDGAALAEQWRATFTDPHEGVDRATLHALLAGGSTAAEYDAARLAARLVGAPTAGAGSSEAFIGFAPHADEETLFTSGGDYTYNIPPWCHTLLIAGLGAGGGGRGGGLFLGGSAGERGTWASTILVRGLNIPWTQSTLAGLHVGTGGSGGANGVSPGNGTGGGETRIAGLLSAPGGRGGGNGTNYNRDPGDHTGVGRDWPNNGNGWGGTGGGANQRGGNGTDGRIIIRAIQ